MLLEAREADQFHRLYQPLLAFAAARLGGVAGVTNLASFKIASIEVKAQVRDSLYDHPELIDEFADTITASRNESEVAIIRSWRNFVRGTFTLERDLKRHTIFLPNESPEVGYGVLGLTTEIVEMLPAPLPVMVDAVLLPWHGRIVCDGMVSSYSVVLGSGIRSSLRENYRRAREEGKIITTLGTQDALATHPAATPRKRHSAIRRFLRRCPQTIEEFKDRYGEPWHELSGDAALEYSPWRIDGQPALEADQLMVYNNVLRGRVLYVYAVGGRISHVSVHPKGAA